MLEWRAGRGIRRKEPGALDIAVAKRIVSGPIECPARTLRLFHRKRIQRMKHELDQPFLIWAWVFTNPVEVIVGLATVAAFFAWLGRGKDGALDRLRELALFALGPLCVLAIFFPSASIFVTLMMFANDEATKYESVDGTAIWKLGEFEVEQLLSAYASAQWIVFIGAAYSVLIWLLAIVKWVIRGDDDAEEK